MVSIFTINLFRGANILQITGIKNNTFTGRVDKPLLKIIHDANVATKDKPVLRHRVLSALQAIRKTTNDISTKKPEYKMFHLIIADWNSANIKSMEMGLRLDSSPTFKVGGRNFVYDRFEYPLEEFLFSLLPERMVNLLRLGKASDLEKNTSISILRQLKKFLKKN